MAFTHKNLPSHGSAAWNKHVEKSIAEQKAIGTKGATLRKVVKYLRSPDYHQDMKNAVHPKLPQFTRVPHSGQDFNILGHAAVPGGHAGYGRSM
jgi:hypothetical protein